MPNIDENISAWVDLYAAADATAADLLCDRHDPSNTAFTLVDADRAVSTLTFGEVQEGSRRLAAGLAARGVGRGDCVGVMMSKRSEYVISVMALWRLGAVLVPMFTAFSTGAVRVRVEGSGAKVVITEGRFRSAVDPIEGVDVITVDDEFADLLSCEPRQGEPVAVGGDGALALLFTSGTTGKPKGVPIPLKALAAFRSYMVFGLDVTESDVYWNAADPGWAYGLYYGVLGPLAIGSGNILADLPFSPENVRDILTSQGVTNFAGAPTMYRAMAKCETFGQHGLRRASSAGEPLTPDVVAWSGDGLGVEVRDHYGQTEHGMVIGNAWHDSVREPVRIASMGRALPGFSAAIVGSQLALDVQCSPLMFFSGYHEEPEKSAERFTHDGRWYLTGDSARTDDDGHFFFSARDDDVILAAGYRIGPFDVESALSNHHDVADVAVVGKPDELRGEVVVAYVVLRDEAVPGEGLAAELKDLVKRDYSAHAYPRQVHFVDSLPKTPSGKTQRHLLRQRQD